MKIRLNTLSLETTRRCNLRCAHCMRGKSQNVDLKEEYIDSILDNNEIAKIEELFFSGGEPTLNSNIIIYTVDKIINRNLDVGKIYMITNGQIFDKELVESFSRFNKYKNEQITSKRTIHTFSNIGFSMDKFHKNINDKIFDQYMKYEDEFNFGINDMSNRYILKTGFATTGIEFNYSLITPDYSYDKMDDTYTILTPLYLTATGNVTSNGNGQYIDMDRMNMGNIKDKALVDMLAEYKTTEYDINKEKLLVKKYK